MNGFLRLAAVVIVLTSLSFADERYTFVPGSGYVLNPKTAPQSMLNFRAGFDHYEAFLKQLNIKPNTNAEAAITKATLEARLLSFKRMDAMKPYQNAAEDVWNRMDIETLKDEVRSLKTIYTIMLNELAPEGISQEVVETFLEKNIRDTVSVTSSDPPLKELDAFDLFEKEE
jgi:hypothetical protein